MDKRIYKSSTFDRVLYSLIAFGILVPGLWVILYGISKHSYDWPLAAGGIVLCSYTIYILQKFFTYKIVLQEDRIEIHKLDNVQSIRYEDIINIFEKGKAFYIIDRVMKDGEYCLRGTANTKYSGNEENVKLSLHRLPAVQGSYIPNYEDILHYISEKSGLNIDEKRDIVNKKSLFSSLYFLKDVDYNQLKKFDIFKMFSPYIIIGLTFLMTLVEYYASSKGNYPLEIDIYVKYVIPVLAVIGLNVLVLNTIYYLKKLSELKAKRLNMPKLYIVFFMVFNIVLTAGIFTIFLTAANGPWL